MPNHSLAPRSALAIAVAISIGLTGLSASAATPVADYKNFRSIKGLKLNGEAARDGRKLKLTETVEQTSSAFTKRRSLKTTRSFSSQFLISQEGGADGLAFVILNGPKSVLGEGGSGNGYLGLEKSLAVEFDLFRSDDFGDPPQPHIALHDEGDPGDPIGEAVPFPLGNGKVRAWVTYNAKNKRMKIYASEGRRRPNQPLISEIANLRAKVGSRSARVGFTAATGGLASVQHVLGWKLKQKRKRR